MSMNSSASNAAGGVNCTLDLDKGWEFREDAANEKWRAVAQFPTNVHLDLLHHKLIPDPHLLQNETKVQWVGDRTWLYRTTFNCSSVTLASGRAYLVFHGLDTFAEVIFNGHSVLHADNMFRTWEAEVSEWCRPGSNELLVRFKSASKEGEAIVSHNRSHKWGCWNGDVSRLAVRKAQYHFGWDWGPRLITCGPWRNIEFRTCTSRILDLHYETHLSADLSSADISLIARIEGDAPNVQMAILWGGKEVCSQTVDIRNGTASVTFHKKQPKLWQPTGHGEQNLYIVRAAICETHRIVDSVQKKMGVRKVRLVQSKVASGGKTFYFKVNNTPIFCRGSNWIPADSFIPRIPGQKYSDLLSLLVDGQQNMLRVWGGGIYEEDCFYDICDELGILVWQDFMFACGNYPASDSFLASVRQEAICNVSRLRTHPCVVIFAGNNEDYQYQESEGLQYDFKDKDPSNWLKTDFPARYIYEHLLPEVMHSVAPSIEYHFGCPYGGRNTRDPTIGDIHQWNVWHGTQERYQDFGKLGGRFVSEFGMEAFPHIGTLDYFLDGEKEERFNCSQTVDFHNKAVGQDRRLAIYLAENFRYSTTDLESYIYATQLMQADCLAAAYRVWKLRWNTQRECGGVLVWQLNDCWPAISWSITDYFLRPKLSYYTIKREMANISVSVVREDSKEVTTLEIWGTNFTSASISYHLKLRGWDIKTGNEVPQFFMPQDGMLDKNCSILISKFKFQNSTGPDAVGSGVVIAAYLLDGNSLIARSVNWPDPLKYLHMPVPEIKLQAHKDKFSEADPQSATQQLLVTTAKPVKGLVLDYSSTSIILGDNCFDLVPDDGVIFSVLNKTGKKLEPPEMMYYGKNTDKIASET